MANWPGIYNTGTASVEQGSTTVTLHAAGPVEQALRPGDRFGSHVGMPIRIASVAAGSLTLAYPWPGPSQSEAPYEIALTPYDSGYRQALQTVLDRYGGGAVAALAEVAGALDKGVHFTGPDTMATHDLTPFARTLLDDADAAAVYATLGTIPDARLPSRLAPVNVRPLPGGNYNNAVENGVYIGQGSASNAPPGNVRFGPLTVYRSGQHYIVQVARFGALNVGNSLFDEAVRGSNDGGATWSEWIVRYNNSIIPSERIPNLPASKIASGEFDAARIPANLTPDKAFRRGNILGTVSQSGGVPTGAVIERGRNATGDYTKFADGTMICSQLAVANQTGPTITFPAAFADIGAHPVKVTATPREILSGALGGSYVIEVGSVTATSFSLKALGHLPSSIIETSATCSVISIGRWF